MIFLKGRLSYLGAETPETSARVAVVVPLQRSVDRDRPFENCGLTEGTGAPHQRMVISVNVETGDEDQSQLRYE